MAFNLRHRHFLKELDFTPTRCAFEVAAYDQGAQVTYLEPSDKPLRQVRLAYLGDARFNMGNSLLIGAAKTGMDFRVVAPKSLQPDPQLVERTGNPQVKFLHCLPAFQNRETKIGEEIYQKLGVESMEVDEEVFESQASL